VVSTAESPRQLISSTENIVRHLRLSSCETPSLTRGRVCNLSAQLLLDLASAVTLRRKSRRTQDHLLLPHMTLGSLSVASYDSHGYNEGILARLHKAWHLSTLLFTTSWHWPTA
jgi:hypothetical protein